MLIPSHPFSLSILELSIRESHAHIPFFLPAVISLSCIHLFGRSPQLLGVPRDSHWYFDSSVDSLNSTDTSLVRPIVQGISRGLEAIVSNIATLDVVRVALAHTLAQGIVRKQRV